MGLNQQETVSPQTSDTTQMPFGEWVFRRLHQLGTKSVFGVPVDFNLPLLEHAYSVEGMQWVGTCNELNAGYAADGYSRYTNKIGVTITTYGVGELSALNALSGAFAEDVKVLHIVGVTPTKFRTPEKQHMNIHHLIPAPHDANFVGPNHQVYYDMIKDRVSCSSAWLDDINTAAAEFDTVLRDIFKHSKPGYVFIPVDFSDRIIDSSSLDQVYSLESILDDEKDQEKVDEITEKIADLLYTSKNPAIIGDILCDRFGVTHELRQFVQKTKIMNFSSYMAKSVLDETQETFKGIYNGSETDQHIIDVMDTADLVLHFGIVSNEINNGHYSYNIKAPYVELHKDYVTINGEVSRGVNFVHVLKQLLVKLDTSKLNIQSPVVEPVAKKVKENASTDGEVTMGYLQKRLSDYLNPKDVYICETGSFQFGVRAFNFPSQLKYISQGFYLSIGMALPAALGIGMGMKDHPNCHVYENKDDGYIPRLILTEGDGSAQMTIQEMTSFLRYNIPIEIFIWNNDGYTVERMINGPTRSYNDIMSWKWTALLTAFGDFDGKLSKSDTIDNIAEFESKIMASQKRERSIHLWDVKLPVMDVPVELQAMAEACKKVE